VNVKESLYLTYPSRKTLAITLHNPARSAAAPPLPKKSCMPATVAMGLRVPAATTSHTSTTHVAVAPSLSTLTPPITSTSQVQVSNMNSEGLQTPESAAEQLSRERVIMDVTRSVPTQPKKKPKSDKPREGQTCRKCGIRTCPGKKSVVNCKNSCRDCGKTDCQGRNPKRPKRTCSTAWIGVNVDD
jgi:hypothetical protein